MAKATRVFSTPPTSTPIDTHRRRFLAVAAGASVASVGTLAVAAAMPASAPDSATCAVDPIFAAIERHKAFSVEYTAAVDRWADLEPDDPDYVDYQDENSRAADVFFDRMEILFSFRPSTVAGVAALLKYISELEEWQMPAGLEDSYGKENAQALCASLAAALEQIGGAA